ncbi:MAG TPA: hypothetical protein VMV10_14985 [Pirellulales bacterium]|nr:hypothetical protein [Pirellulales bacterium]
MKAKVKFDKKQLKPLLIQHVEKIVFGVLAVVALVLCWSAIGLTPYQGTPDDLNKKAADVRTRVANSTPPEKFEDLPAKRNLGGMLDNALVSVNPALFPMAEISRPYSDHKVRRQQPALLVVQDPRAAAGFGAIAMSDQALGRDRLIASRNPARGPMGGMMGGGMMGPQMMAGGEGSDMYQGGAPGGMMDPSMMQEMMQGGMRRGGDGGDDMYGGGAPGGMMDPSMMQEMMQGGMEGMRGNAGRGRKKKTKPAPKPKAKPVFEPEKLALEAPPNSKLDGRYWVSVVGLIPSWDQEAEFQKVFRDATKTYATDTPEYVYCDVERAEVASPGEVGEYVALDMDQVIDDMEKWAAVYPAMIDKKYLTPSPDVTAPLPPLVRANHDPNAIRHPKIPLAGEASAEENKAAAAAAAELKDEADGDGKSRRGRRAGRNRAGMPRGMPGGMQMGMGMGMGMSGRPGVAKEKIENMLFRFFDFTVQPGKKYKYRIRLALENPNWNKPVQYLKSPDLAKEEFIYTDWSEPTPEVFVPLGSELLAGDANPKAGPKDPSAKILVRQFDKEKAVTAVHVFDLTRGATANADEVEVHTTNSSPGGAPPASTEKVDFRTDATMVDLVGGDKLVGFPKETKSPGRILVMRSDGELAMLSEFSDAERYELQTYLLQEAKEADKPNTLAAPGGTGAGAADSPAGKNPYSDFFKDDAGNKKGRGKR